MNVTTNWLNSCVDTPVEVDEMIDALERVGFACEEREDLPHGDVRIDLEITSNRGDCVSVIGLARELAAATGRSVVTPKTRVTSDSVGAESASDVTSVNVEATDLCPYFSAQIIRNVKVGPSPDWLRERIEAVGLRSVNNVVDVSNYVLYELGQPLHTFDLAKLDEQRIIVRRAHPKEKLTAIDGSKLTLSDQMLVIADANKAVSVAGVMGGLETEVSETTTDLLLEAASFLPSSIRTTSRRLKLMSDSSYRFERGVHPNTVRDAAEYAAAMIVKVAGGTLAKGAVITAEPMPDQIHVSMRSARCCAIAGIDIPTNQMVLLLETLGIVTSIQGTRDAVDEVLICTIPWFRLDLTREIDLIEEIIRLHGFDQLPPHDKMAIEVIGPQEDFVRQRTAEDVLVACGFHEVVTYTFVSMKAAKQFLPNGYELLSVGDDRRKAEPVLRPSLIPSLLACRKRNQDSGFADGVKLFERASCFCKHEGQKVERINVGLILDAPDPQIGLREMRGAIETAIKTVLGASTRIAVQPVDVKWFADDSSAVLRVDGDVLGTFGLIHPSVQAAYDLRSKVVVAEIGLTDFLTREITQTSAVETEKHPAIQRDLSIIIDDEVAWSKIEDVIYGAKPKYLAMLDFIGAYRGKQAGAGKKSVSLRMTFRASDRTLRHEEVDPAVKDVMSKLTSEAGAVLRE